MTSLPDALARLTNLQWLELNNNQLASLPDWLAQLTNLQILCFSNNQLTSLPEILAQLINLQSLDLTDNLLEDLPNALAQLTQIRSLALGENKLAILPSCVTKLAHLQHLDLSNNQLTSLSDELAQLTHLRSLNLSNNQLTNLPDWLAQLTNLQTLYLDNNQLTSLPETLVQLTNLQSLDLSNNDLTSLPETLVQLANLKLLNFRNNQLTSLPEKWAQLTDLQWLDLSNNQLTNLPETLTNLRQLVHIFVSNNTLRDIASDFGQLQHTVLGLDNNPLNPDLAAAYAQGTETLLQYLRERAVEETILNEAKLILVGEGNVGKSSLLAALCGEPWVEGRSTTHGIEIKPIASTDPDSGVELTLNGWDFGGQPVYRPTHQLFFSAPAVYLVVWKPREGPEGGFVSEWITLIKNRAFNPERPDERPRILVVATHGGPKERQAHIDEQALRTQFKDLIVGFYHVDSYSGFGMQELSQAVACTAVSIPQVGRAVPGSWKRVLDAIQQRSAQDAYISYEQFSAICAEQEVSAFTTSIYARILNELGYLIHYADDAALKDIVILRAEWLSKAISFVLEDAEAKANNGLIRHARLSQIWNDPARPPEERYPPVLHPAFLRLMERFELSYRITQPGRGDAPSDTSLIAQLIPGGRPDTLAAAWGPSLDEGDSECVQVCRIVNIDGVPASAEGLLYQLIVRLHRYSLGRDDYAQSCHWQTGLLLDDAYNGRAMLERIGTDIRITVRAAYPERFLHMLSEEVKWLVKTFWKGLDCQVMVPCQEPCGLKEPGRGLFEITKLIESHRRGRTEYPCQIPACGEWHSIDALLVRPAPLPPVHEALAELKRDVGEIAQGIEEGFHTTRADLRRLISQIDDQYTRLMATLVDEGRDAPRLFSMIPVDPGFWGRPTWANQRIRITLWCEHARMPLPELWNDRSRGVYEFDVPREWLVKAAPIAKLIANTLALGLPVAGAAIKLSMDQAAYSQIENSLDLSEKSFGALLEGGGAVGDWLTKDDDAPATPAARPARPGEHRYGDAHEGHGAALRQIQALIKERDPGFGGLIQVQDRQRQFMWIHPRFEKEYRPDPPMIPQAE